jgi:hypothetical protein
MNTLRTILLMVLLLSIAMVAGCQEEHARYDNPTNKKKVIWEPTATGFYRPNVVYPAAQ